jgi:hypothetical protein
MKKEEAKKNLKRLRISLKKEQVSEKYPDK